MSQPAAKKSAQLVTLDRAMKDLPPMPMAVSKILTLTGSENSRADEVEKYIATDQAISTKVLRVVNSPYFGLESQVSSLSQAVLILGFEQVRNLVLSLSSAKLFAASSPAIKAIHLELWKHAFATGAAAQIVARRCRLDLKEHDFVFSGGLLSNVGALFLAAQYSKPYEAIWTKALNEGGQISDFEARAFGVHHAELGQQLGVLWKFPENLCLLVGRHEGPFGGDPIPSLYCVHAGDRIARVAIRPKEEWGEIEHIDPLVLEWMKFSKKDFQLVIEEAAQKLESASDMIGLLSG
jgi:HD-like signal output (HDOD) protein